MTHDRLDFPTDQELGAYLDEGMSPEAMLRIEEWIREDPTVRERIISCLGARGVDDCSVGEIWRKNRLSCPSRTELGIYLLGGAEERDGQYIRFHIATVGCRICQANLEDLRFSEPNVGPRATRQQKFFQSSVGRIIRDRPE